MRLIKRLHQYDVMRANKAPFAFGLEPRVPFLDKEFLDVSMTLDPADKMVCPVCREPYMHSMSLTSQKAVLKILLAWKPLTTGDDRGMPLDSRMPVLNILVPVCMAECQLC